MSLENVNFSTHTVTDWNHLSDDRLDRQVKAAPTDARGRLQTPPNPRARTYWTVSKRGA